jgi:hypothetical protein
VNSPAAGRAYVDSVGRLADCPPTFNRRTPSDGTPRRRWQPHPHRAHRHRADGHFSCWCSRAAPTPNGPVAKTRR